MYNALIKLEKEDRPIRVAVVGAGGSMGKGICLQTKLTPGLRLAAAIDLDIDAAREAAILSGHPGVIVGTNLLSILDRGRIDVLVEATNSIGSAAEYCIAALKAKIHVVLMNAEIDLLLGPYLNRLAEENGVIITSDAGDQHGVLARMIEEIKIFGLEIVMAGNIKGFLNRYATLEEMRKEAEKRRLNPVQCVGYTDGTKLNIEMSIVANAFNLTPWQRGMIGPECDDITEIFDKLIFDYTTLEGMRRGPVVDYVLGAKPGGGVFVIGYCDEPIQQFYLSYYKRGMGPFYLFYRPYHLCHLETPRAIAKAFLFQKKVLSPIFGKPTDVYAFAKRDLQKGFAISSGIGSDNFYGMIDSADKDLVPITLLDNEETAKPILKGSIDKDQPLTWEDIHFPETELMKLYNRQREILRETQTRSQILAT